MIGQQLAHYEILSLLGQGGMGAVYRARDSKLGREVAIKLLPPELSEDPERIARFEREARVLASFTHPNIAAIHGFEEAGGVRFLVMELVEGEDLQSRLARGPLAVDEALGLARQVAEGLEAAHERNTVHRDLKPANLLLGPDGTIKILDFGLARAADGGDDPDLENSPTITAAMTQAGTILGTVAYMSPEQARGKAVDKRADIWAFGVIVVEMLTGGRLFEGETISDTMASVLKTEVDLDTLPSGTPAHVKALLARCLDRDPATRLRDIGEARVALSRDGEPVPSAPGRGRSPWVGAVAGILGGVVIGLLAMALRGDAPEAPVMPSMRFEIPLVQPPANVHLAWDPSGERLVYGDAGQLWLRHLGDHLAQPIPNSEGGIHPSWSPDGQWIAFSVGLDLFKMQPDGSRRISLCQLPDALHPTAGSVDWIDNETLLLATGDRGLLRVAASGGSPEVLLAPNEDELDFHSGYALPGGRGVLFSPHVGAGFDTIELFDGRGRRQLYAHGPGSFINVPQYSQGQLLFIAVRQNAGLWTIPYSLDEGAVVGTPTLLAPEANYFAVSPQGHLAYTVDAGDVDSDLLLLDRDGREVLAVARGLSGVATEPALSPNGLELAVPLRDEDVDIWVYQLESGERRRVVFGDGDQQWPAWSPDGRTLAYSVGTLRERRAYLRDLDSGVDTPFGDVPANELNFSSVGGAVAFSYQNEQLGWNLGYSADAGSGEWTNITMTASTERDPAISPDGRYLAYMADVSGRPEIYLRRFPDGEEHWRMSRDGGVEPFWGPGGEALYFRNGDALMEVPLQTSPRLVLGEAREVFSVDGLQWVVAGRSDGEFLVGQEADGGTGDRGILVWVGW